MSGNQQTTGLAGKEGREIIGAVEMIDYISCFFENVEPPVGLSCTESHAVIEVTPPTFLATWTNSVPFLDMECLGMIVIGSKYFLDDLVFTGCV